MVAYFLSYSLESSRNLYVGLKLILHSEKPPKALLLEIVWFNSSFSSKGFRSFWETRLTISLVVNESTSSRKLRSPNQKTKSWSMTELIFSLWNVCDWIMEWKSAIRLASFLSWGERWQLTRQMELPLKLKRIDTAPLLPYKIKRWEINLLLIWQNTKL